MQLSEAELDTRARQHMLRQRVSYAEALSFVVAEAKVMPVARQAPEADPDEAERTLHKLAVHHAQKHGVSYAEAVRAVMDQRDSDRAATPKTGLGVIGATSEDLALHQRAQQYASAHSVSYAEAVGAAARHGGARIASFAEAQAASVTAAALQRPVEIFRAGTHTGMEGSTWTFTQKDIEAMAAAYRTELREAPLTLGHPENDLPSYGWVRSLQATPDGRLLMNAERIDPQLIELVDKGSFKKRSASFYPPDHPSNPQPGSWYLRHVAWLGAQQPGVSGLADIH